MVWKVTQGFYLGDKMFVMQSCEWLFIKCPVLYCVTNEITFVCQDRYVNYSLKYINTAHEFSIQAFPHADHVSRDLNAAARHGRVRSMRLVVPGNLARKVCVQR
jgi:hypothetical protein